MPHCLSHVDWLALSPRAQLMTRFIRTDRGEPVLGRGVYAVDPEERGRRKAELAAQLSAGGAAPAATPPAAATGMAPRNSAIEFVTAPYTEQENSEHVASFRRQGWCCLRDVFVRASVFEFRQQLVASCPPGAGQVPADWPGLAEPALAPRLRGSVPQLLAPPHPRGGAPTGAQLFELAWQADPGPSEVQGWHRDRRGGAGTPGDAADATADRYRFPEAVHCSLYYRDMLTPDCGATEIVSASHLDEACRMPADGDAESVTPFALRAQDVIVWDQRAWHRRGRFAPSAADPDDRRVMSIFGWHQSQMFAGTVSVARLDVLPMSASIAHG
jgi:hypothetical protein